MFSAVVLHRIVAAAESAVSAALGGGAIEFYRGLDPAVRVAVTLAAALVLGLVVLGILPAYSIGVVRTGRRSPVISTTVGIPGTLVLAGFLYVGTLIADTTVGVFFAIPLVSVGLIFLPAWTALGLVVVGAAIGDRFGADGTFRWLLVGSALVAVATLVPAAAAAAASIAAVVGVGAGVRVLLGVGVTSGPDERTVPPANRV